MKKSQKILLIIGIVIIIVVPSVAIGVYFYIQSQLKQTTVSIENIELLDISKDGFTARVDFTINAASSQEVSFRIINIGVFYNADLMGNGTASQVEFSTKETIHQTDFTLTVLDQSLYDSLLEDFIMSDLVTLDIAVDIEFLGALSNLPSQSVTTEAILSGLNGLPFSIESLNISDIKDDELSVEIEANVNNTGTIEATFAALQVDINFKDQKVGKITEKNVTFVQGLNQFIFIASLNATNNQLIEDFIENETLDLVLDGAIQLKESDSEEDYIPIFTRNFELAGLDGLDPSIISMDLMNTMQNTLIMAVNTSLDNPSNLDFTLSELNIDISYQGEWIGDAAGSNLTLIKGQNTFILTATLSGNETLLSELLTQYLAGDNITLSFNVSTILMGSEGYEMTINQLLPDIEIPGITEDLVGVSVDMITLDLGDLPSSVTYTIGTTITIYNPMNFAINVTAFEGRLEYDDLDGASYSIPFVDSWSYPAKNDIFLTDLDFDWSTTPLELASYGNASDYYQFSDSDIEQGIRLYDEYVDKNQLYVDVVQGIVTIQIGSFEISITVEIYDIFVT
ncbi:MAG: hypothetical protein GF308_21795 [Candidatus Heimdallarchaeota archaeon]|nr:hypothetical protein [Candidatus Heimdallarchaeota archaeon]